MRCVCELTDTVGLPIGLGALSGLVTGQTSRSNWFTVSRTLSDPWVQSL